MKTDNKYKDWDILEDLPQGWVIDKTAGSPAPNTVFITNGESVLNGQKRALLKVESKKMPTVSKMEITTEVKKDLTNNVQYVFPAKTVNDLARLKFKTHLLQEITFDLMVCEIEGWNKKEYVNELKKLINSIDTSGKKNVISLPNLFSEVGL